MKKLILSAFLLAGMTFVACSDDDSDPTNPDCVPCSAMIPEVCPGDNGNAYVGTTDMGQEFAAFFAAHCDGTNPNPNPTGNCVTCAAYEIQGQQMPEMEICENEAGNAVVSGIDTGMAFATYVQTIEMVTSCN
jgi:hypothetical protein